MASLGYNYVITVFVIVVLTAESHGAVTDIMDRCCEVGRQWYSTQAERCLHHTAPVPGVAVEDQGACRALIQLCCLQHRQERQCNLGKLGALSGQGCSALHSRESSQDARECCNCCQLGITARDQSLTCSLFSRYGNQCDRAFKDCCESTTRGQQQQHRGHTTEPSTQPDLFAGSLSSGICGRFPGQLCEQICADVAGSYSCSCRAGYTLQSDRRTCRQNDVDECALGIHTCSYDQRCVNTQDSFRCEDIDSGNCHPGFTWNRQSRQCEDVDECITTAGSSPLCPGSQFCINTAGSYRCVSLDGTEVSDADSYHGFVLPPAGGTTVSTITKTTISPIPVDSLCDPGFAFNTPAARCEDIDECSLIQCPELNEMCRNTIGSYSCIKMCGKGFKYELRHACEDINECAMNKDTCSEGQTCENSIGSYHCRRSLSCGTGYTLDQYTQDCIDDDECRMGTHNCDAARECKNILGSFRCVTKVCPQGFRLDYDNGNCNPVVCARGMKPDSVGNCVDIDECTERPEVCRPDQECRNQVGSYSCFTRLTCSAGYKANELGTRCDDIDECRTGTHDCTGVLMECVNRPGSYQCQCPTGYQVNHLTKSCDDQDECMYDPQICGQNSRCENTHGSYRCVCREGYMEERSGNNLLCKDIDECARPGMCQHRCTNSWGSFECTCNEGYKLSSDNRTCDDADECAMAAQKGIQLCLGRCENTHGSFICACPPGYRLSEDGVTCQDVNECVMRIANCRGANDICINTRGGHKCQAVDCPKGFVRAPILNNRNSNVKCQRKTYLCPQGDVECLYAPLSYSTNFITFPSKIRIPADLFTMRGPLSPYRRLVFDLRVVKSEDPLTGQSRVDRSFFNVHQVQENEAVVQLLREVDGPQDVELQLDMNIYSKEFRANNDEVFFGTAVARIYIYVTKDDW